MAKYILGGGVAGLVSAFYNPDHIVITDKVGGWQNLNKFKLGPRVIEVTPATTAFLRKLGFQTDKVKLVNIGYLNSGRGTPDSLPHEDFKKLYALKTRELELRHQTSIMSGGKNVLTVFDIDYDIVLQYLEAAITPSRFILGKVTDIDLENEIITWNSEVNYSDRYEEIINTLPYTLFLKLANNPFIIFGDHDFTAFHTTFLKLSYSNYTEFAEWKKQFSYVYCLDTVYHRVNFYDDYAVAEVKGMLKDYQWSYSFLDSVVIPFAQIKNSYDDLQSFTHNIQCVGRYAEWNHKIKLEQVVERWESKI